MKYLVIAAHPDDEILGCGGSMAKWCKDGHVVHVLIMAEGATSRDKSRDRVTRQKELSHLARSAKKAGEILGVASVELLDYPDNRMDSVDLLDVVKSVEEHIDKNNPEVVVTHHSGDLNIDHQLVHEAVVTASRPQNDLPIKTLLFFEVPSSTEWQLPGRVPLFAPNWFVDISNIVDRKIRAFEVYAEELRDWPHPRSIKGVEYRARWRCATVGFEAAEAFSLGRELR